MPHLPTVLWLCLLAQYGFAADSPSRPMPSGNLWIEFKESVSAKKRDEIHRDAGARLIYRSKNFSTDIVQPRRPASRFPTNSACEVYKNRPDVALCRSDLVSVPHDPTCAECRALERAHPLKEVIHTLERPVSALSGACKAIDNQGHEPHMGGTLSAFWGYELVGVDLARDAIAQSGISSKKVPVASGENFRLKAMPPEYLSQALQKQKDSESIPHGNQMIHIVTGQLPYGVSGNVEIVAKSELGQHGLEMADRVLASGAKLYAASVTHPSAEVFRTFSARGIISVRSAGNAFPRPDHYQEGPEHSIIVGQLSPYGGMSGDSSAYPEVTIAAPGLNYSFDGESTDLFSGTSGAQPLVSGCIANALSLVPDLSPQEARALVVNTAIPTLNSKESPRLNGAGTLNCYKMARVAVNLAKNPSRRAELLEAGSKLYDFSSEVESMLAEPNSAATSECKRSARLLLLRKAFLLNPQQKAITQEIAALYTELGYPGNAFAYRSMVEPLSPEELNTLHQKIRANTTDKGLESDLVRLAAADPKRNIELLRRALKSRDLGAQPEILAITFGHGTLADAEIEDAMAQMLRDGKVDGFNHGQFFKKHKEYGFPPKKLFDVCAAKLPELQTTPNQNLEVACMILVSTYPGQALPFLSSQLDRNSTHFKDAFLRHIEYPPLPKELLTEVLQHRSWSADERARIQKVIASR